MSGAAPEVLYLVNGEFNDWCYGDTLAKPRAFTWTPEIGSEADGLIVTNNTFYLTSPAIDCSEFYSNVLLSFNRFLGVGPFPFDPRLRP